MLKVFLVEDEIVMREGIKNNINWEAEGFVFVGESSDGELAYPLIQKLQPDIIITDIKMPFMDGLELSRLIKAEMPNIKIIILSGYDEFEYAKEAISIGVTDYLVKPIAGAKLLETVKQVAQIVEKENEQKKFLETFKKERMENDHLEKQKFFVNLISNQKTVSELLEKGKQLGIDLAAEDYNIILYKVFSNEEELLETYSKEALEIGEKIKLLVKDSNSIIMFERGIEGWAFLIKSFDGLKTKEIEEEFISQFKNIVKAYSGIAYFGGIGMVVNRLRELYKSFHEANKAFAYRYIVPKNQVIRHDNMVVSVDSGISLNSLDVGKMDRTVVERFLKTGFVGEIDYFIEEYFISLGRDNINSLLFRQYVTMDMYFCAVSFMEYLGYGSELISEKCGNFINIAVGNTNVDTTKEYIRKLFMEVISLREMASQKKYSSLLESAKKYIQENYCKEEISLNSVAASVNLSPNHFSAIFSQEMDHTFIEYLTMVRMDKAKELLKCSNMKSSEVGYEVGYKDPHYFSYIFKKTQDCTPREFKLRV